MKAGISQSLSDSGRIIKSAKLNVWRYRKATSPKPIVWGGYRKKKEQVTAGNSSVFMAL